MADNSENKKKPPKVPIPVKLVVGAIAGVVGTTCIFPIDMVKTRLQATKGVYSGPIDCFNKIRLTEGGFRAFYRGLVPNLVGVTPEKAIKLAANEGLRELLENEDGTISLFNEIVAGAGAGFCQVIATNPMELIKIRMQMQATLPASQRQSAVEVVRSLGVKGVYSGTAATLLRDVPFSFIFFPLYANLKALFARPDGTNSLGSVLLAGGMAGSFASGFVTPTDVVKTRLQVNGGRERYGNIMNCFSTIIREEGFSALYKGAIPRMVVVGPLFAITLLSFEAQKNYMIKKGLI